LVFEFEFIWAWLVWMLYFNLSKSLFDLNVT
jgi:hypothetical protein